MDLNTLFRSVNQKLLDFLFPPHCISCGKGGSFLCRKCRNTLVYLKPPLCTQCSKPIYAGTVCSKCLSQTWDIDEICSIFKYGGVIRQAIIQLKYENMKVLADPLSHCMAQYLRKHPMSFDVIVPVPIHKQRLRERGYNQSSLLAKRLGYMIRKPVVEGDLLRTKHTPSQAKSASLDQRRTNIRNAFNCIGSNLTGKRVLLIDDVCTSGSTLDSCAISLKKAGATSVLGLTLAKEI